MEQLQLLLRDQKKEVSVDIITACNTFKDALKLCKSISGYEDKQLCGHLEMDPGHWSKIFTNGGHFPENKLMDFMDLCGNRIPLIWLALKCGYSLTPLKSELEIQIEDLQAQLAEREKEIEVLAKYRAKGII